jgi:hypothetical protein
MLLLPAWANTCCDLRPTSASSQRSSARSLTELPACPSTFNMVSPVSSLVSPVLVTPWLLLPSVLPRRKLALLDTMLPSIAETVASSVLGCCCCCWPAAELVSGAEAGVSGLVASHHLA